jgi:hypothetical protein
MVLGPAGFKARDGQLLTRLQGRDDQDERMLW